MNWIPRISICSIAAKTKSGWFLPMLRTARNHHQTKKYIHTRYSNQRLVGGFNPFEKYQSNWIISPSRGENIKYLKPPPRKRLELQFASAFFFPSLEMALSLKYKKKDRPGNFVSRPPFHQIGDPEMDPSSRTCIFPDLPKKNTSFSWSFFLAVNLLGIFKMAFQNLYQTWMCLKQFGGGGVGSTRSSCWSGEVSWAPLIFEFDKLDRQEGRGRKQFLLYTLW